MNATFSPDMLKQAIEDAIVINNSQIATAKSFILRNFESKTENLLKMFLVHMEVSIPEIINVNDPITRKAQAIESSKAISFQLAFCEAIFQLLHRGYILPLSLTLREINPHISWTSVTKTSGGQSAGFNLDNYKIAIPPVIRVAPSKSQNLNTFLQDEDIFMRNLNIPNLHKDIEISLREAVNCFAYDLFLPSLAMLSRAIEGTWIEFGLAISVYPENNNDERLRNLILDKFASIPKKIQAIIKQYQDRERYRKIWKDSGITPNHLNSVSVWSDTVREYRNAIHYQIDPKTSLSFESVSSLLLGAIPNVKKIYQIINSLNNSSEKIYKDGAT